MNSNLIAKASADVMRILVIEEGEDLEGMSLAQIAIEHAASKKMDRFSEAEPLILMDPECTYNYARQVLQCRWPEGEHIILASAKSGNVFDVCLAYEYVRDVIQGPWPEAEEALMADPYYAALYPKLLEWFEATNRGEFLLFFEPDPRFLLAQIEAEQN